MKYDFPHNFHIPVMGIGFTVDTPVKVARYGINSTVSIIEDELLELIRKHYAELYQLEYNSIEKYTTDYRAKRICAYLNVLNKIVAMQVATMKSSHIKVDEVEKYFTLLHHSHPMRKLYSQINSLPNHEFQHASKTLLSYIQPGNIEVNIMTKVDKPAFDINGNPLSPEFSDALSALRGFATSDLNSSIVFSAGFNPRLYGYCEQFQDFYPTENKLPVKKIILKVSDFRSAMIQGKFLAKKGLWISEFRIESGLNCGGHAFATEGLLMGPILEEFKMKRAELFDTLFSMCQEALLQNGKFQFQEAPELKISAQGGVGNALEHEFLLKYYLLDSIGWGSPFLLVPEATNVDEETLSSLSTAVPEDYYLSNASPLGVPFNNFRKSSSENLRKSRILKGKSGSPCLKKYLQSNTEFSVKPICTASTTYQFHKLRQLKQQHLSDEDYKIQVDLIQEKDCLCEGLSEPVLKVNQIKHQNDFGAVTICPGPNLAYFSGVFTLRQMVDHIYGRANVLNQHHRPNVFVNELHLYIKYIMKELQNHQRNVSDKTEKYFDRFIENITQGVNYYRNLGLNMIQLYPDLFNEMDKELDQVALQLINLKAKENIQVV